MAGTIRVQVSHLTVNTVYGDRKGRWAGVRWIEGEMEERAARPQKISLSDVMWAIRTPRLTGDTAGYGQVVPLVDPGHPQLRVLWHAHIGALAAPFVPVYLGVEYVPEEFRQHRYLTVGESARFLDARHANEGEPDSLSLVPQGIESTRSATAVFKRLLYLVLQNPDRFLPEVTDVWEGLEQKLLDQHDTMTAIAGALLADGNETLAGKLLTYFSGTELRNALNLAETLAASLEARTRILHTISTGPRPKSEDQIW